MVHRKHRQKIQLVHCVLSELAIDECVVSVLCRKCNLASNDIVRYIDTLKVAGYIDIVKRIVNGSLHNVYFLTTNGVALKMYLDKITNELSWINKI